MVKKENKNGSIYKTSIASFIFIASIFTAAWALDDRMDKKIVTIQNHYSSDSQSIRDMEKTLARIEEQLKNIQARLDDRK